MSLALPLNPWDDWGEIEKKKEGGREQEGMSGNGVAKRSRETGRKRKVRKNVEEDAMEIYTNSGGGRESEREDKESQNGEPGWLSG